MTINFPHFGNGIFSKKMSTQTRLVGRPVEDQFEDFEVASLCGNVKRGQMLVAMLWILVLSLGTADYELADVHSSLRDCRVIPPK